MKRKIKTMSEAMNNNGHTINSSPNWLGFSSSSSYAANDAFHSPLSVMPLKSDGSLCIMEALSTSQSLQGASHEREAMSLSLDSIYYHQNVADQGTQRQQQQQQEMHYFSEMPCHQLYQTSSIQDDRDSQSGDFFSGIFLGQQINTGTLVHSDGSVVAGSGSVESMGCGDLQCLSLSISPGSQSSAISPSDSHCLATQTKKKGSAKMGTKQPAHRKSIDTFGKRTSQYRGVTRHRWTGRYEAHLWDNSCKKEGQTRKGRQGGYDMEEKAARAYDCAALKYWGSQTHINFPLESYQQQLEDMKSMSRQEYIAHLRRKSSGFSRGASMYRGVTRHHQHGRWQARIGRVAGNKDLYLGTFSTQEEAAEAYDIAAIKFRGVSAVTNFDITRYDVEKIMSSNTVLAGEQARRIRDSETTIPQGIVKYINPSVASSHGDIFQVANHENTTSSDWKMVMHQSSQQHEQNANCLKSLAEQNVSVEHDQQQQHYKNLSFSMALQDWMGIESLNSTQMMFDNSLTSTKLDNSHHFSDPSSLVTSLSSSREASPDNSGVITASMLFC
ncbi:AP2-like ethylene-responsive transcription factor ANT [Apium graveolens]|uniref:AP2-like ethylene-responsive transcription factor ANT n=1 Tax=Apium graveolens TaxID=4045 RepID=UPI003D792BAC